MLVVLLMTLSCGGGDGPAGEKPTIVACLIEGEPFPCFAPATFVLQTVAPTAEIRFSKPIQTTTTLDNVTLCAESLHSSSAVAADLRAAMSEQLADVQWLDGDTRLRLKVLGDQEVQLRDGSLVAVVVTFAAGVFSVDGQALDPTTLGPLVIEVDLSGRGGRAMGTSRDVRFCSP